MRPWNAAWAVAPDLADSDSVHTVDEGTCYYLRSALRWTGQRESERGDGLLSLAYREEKRRGPMPLTDTAPDAAK